jgi:hypothetical protein
VARTLIVIMAGLLLLTGCGSYWEDQGTASRTSAEARLRQAEAARQNAQAAIIDAEARGALAESQADALRTAISANADLTRQAVDMADNSEYVWVFAALAFGVLGFAGWSIWTITRRPAATPAATSAPEPPALRPALRPGITIESIAGPVRIEQEEGETRYHFMLRVRQVAEAIQAAEDRMLLEGPDKRR